MINIKLFTSTLPGVQLFIKPNENRGVNPHGNKEPGIY